MAAADDKVSSKATSVTFGKITPLKWWSRLCIRKQEAEVGQLHDTVFMYGHMECPAHYAGTKTLLPLFEVQPTVEFG